MFSRILKNSPPRRRTTLITWPKFIMSFGMSGLIALLVIYLVVTFTKPDIEPVCPEPGSIEMKADQEKTDALRKL